MKIYNELTEKEKLIFNLIDNMLIKLNNIECYNIIKLLEFKYIKRNDETSLNNNIKCNNGVCLQ